MILTIESEDQELINKLSSITMQELANNYSGTCWKHKVWPTK
jgi:hypothetical protein